MEPHRYEIGECVTSVEKRFPNGERHTELVILERLIGTGEPHYQLRDSGGPGLYVLAERQLSPGGPAHVLAPPRLSPVLDRPNPSGSPWAA
jgi:hypothetical protein